MSGRSAFREFVERKTREAERALIPPLRTLEDHSATRKLRTFGSSWTRARYDGDFHLVDPPDRLPAVSLVFVQSRDGNTGAENPDELGGGPTDKHLIYEGLSRVAADAVLAGATTAVGPNVFFSVWHPQFVTLRHDLGLPRHPAQIVISNDGHLDLNNALLFNLPDVPVFVVVGTQCRHRCEASFRERPWITVVRLETNQLIEAFGQLRREHGLARISVVGGRSTASRLIDAGLVQDLCLTTTSRPGGEPNTPFYTGSQPPSLEVIVRKHSVEEISPILFEHLLVNPLSSTR